MTKELLAKAPKWHILQKSIAKYWYCEPELITVEGEKVFQNGDHMKNFYVTCVNGVFKFYYEVKNNA